MPLIGYMKVPDIDGESRRAEHEDWIDLLSIDWNMQQAATMQTGSGRTRSRANVDPITVTKEYDSASPYIALSCMQGKAFEEVEISFRKDSGEAHLDYLTITLKNVVFSHYNLNGSADGEVIVESLGLSFEHITILYTLQADDHSSGDEHEVDYDLAAGA